MSSEELPADLDKLKITPKNEHVKLRDGNPFYSPNSDLGVAINDESTKSTKQLMHSKTRRIRRRSESNIDDFNNKQIDTVFAADNFEIVNPLRCLPGVHKLQLKRGSIGVSKRNLLREPILRIPHDNLSVKYCFGNRSRRMVSLNLDDRSRTNLHKPRTNISIKSSINGISSFRDLISECNLLLDESKSRKGIVDNTWHLTKNFMIWQKGEPGAPKSTSSSHENIADGQAPNFRERTAISSGARLSCSQEASNSASNSRNGDDVTIVELASYFDTMVHIPKKMSSMAEMMYI